MLYPNAHRRGAAAATAVAIFRSLTRAGARKQKHQNLRRSCGVKCFASSPNAPSPNSASRHVEQNSTPIPRITTTHPHTRVEPNIKQENVSDGPDFLSKSYTVTRGISAIFQKRKDSIEWTCTRLPLRLTGSQRSSAAKVAVEAGETA